MKSAVTWCAAAAVLLGVTLSAAGQPMSFIGPGSTPMGDYLRGVGIAATGMGNYNYNTALADQINTQTWMTLNEYIYQSVKIQAREYAERKREALQKNLELRKQIQERIHDHPDALDVLHGDALSAILDDLLSPKVSDSQSRIAQVPLDPDFIRRIPFKLGDKGDTFSMSRLSMKGKKKWAVAFQDPAFKLSCDAYQKAVDKALDLAIDGKMNQQVIEELRKAVDDLDDKVLRTPELLDARNQRQASEARLQIDYLRKMIRLFETLRVQQILGDIDTYPGTTVDELRLFMRKFNLRFAEAETPDERLLYPQLYTALQAQREKTVPPGQ
jgi:hypothetical protein